jgi:hypothetical protein
MWMASLNGIARVTSCFRFFHQASPSCRQLSPQPTRNILYLRFIPFQQKNCSDQFTAKTIGRVYTRAVPPSNVIATLIRRHFNCLRGPPVVGTPNATNKGIMAARCSLGGIPLSPAAQAGCGGLLCAGCRCTWRAIKSKWTFDRRNSAIVSVALGGVEEPPRAPAEVHTARQPIKNSDISPSSCNQTSTPYHDYRHRS